MTGNRADAAELMQDAFLKLWERWDRIDRIDDPTAYLFRVALNGSRMRARAARRAGQRLPVGRDRDRFDEIDLREGVRVLLHDLAPRSETPLTGEIGNLVVVDVATGERTTITDLPMKSYGTWSLFPSFTADGRSVLFRMPRGPSGEVNPVGWDLVPVPVTGGEPTVMRRDATLGASSPRDGSLVYVDPAPWTLFLADADGRNPRMLLEVGEEIGRPVWSPTGSEDAYADPGGVHIVDVATGEVSLVADGEPVDRSW